VPNTTIFIGSSSAARAQAKAVVKAFSAATSTFLPWWDAFTAGRTLLEELDAIKTKVDGSLLLFSPEATAELRGKTEKISNLNVLFELGYFYGVLGKQKVAMLKYGDVFLPSDLGGYLHITGSKFFEPGKTVIVGKRTTEEFQRWIKQL
jgi:predicted nucleotide-binding protein